MSHQSDNAATTESAAVPQASHRSISTHDAGRERAIRAERFRLLYANNPFVLALGSINAVILAIAQWGMVPASTIGLWLTYALGVSVFRFWVTRHYGPMINPTATHTPWESPFLIGTVLAGLGWGATGLWLFPHDPIHQMFTVFLLAGMTAGSVMALSIYPIAFASFAIPALVPAVVRLMIDGTTLGIPMAVMGILFIAHALVTSARMSRTTIASIELRYDNQRLLEDMTKEVEQRRQAESALQETHVELERRVTARTEELAHANAALRGEIDERQRISLALQGSVERFNRAVRGAQEGLWDAALTGTDWFHPDHPVYYSPRFKSLLGFTDEQFPNVMRAWAACAEPDEWERLVTTFTQHLQNRTPFDVELRLRTNHDEVRWYSARGHATWNDDGQPMHMSGSLRDITAQKDLEAQLLQVHKLEAVGRLAAGVAHDFNNLLTPILGYSEVLLSKSEAGSVEARRLGDIRRAALHGATLVRQLLTFGRKQPVTPRVLDLERELAECEELLQRTLGEDIEILYHLSPDTGCIKLDPTQLQQVILNLAVNARDAMPDGGCLTIETQNRDLHTSTKELPPGRYVALRISDTGDGIPPHVLDHIFEPFFTTKEVGKGSGLGLSVVEGIIGQAKGKISVTSTVGTGTSFEILLPEATEAATTPVRSTAAPVAAGHETILVVEDNTPVRELTTHVLTELGYKVLVAHHGLDALDLAARHPGPIGLLLTDVVMPGISGQELARRLERSRPGLRVLYLSGHPAERLVTRGSDRPISPLLSKPFTSEELSRAVRQILSGTHSTSS
ncbi:MAG: ATP-binding protein [Nitrospiraceae bacterium]